jgi:hypothetical protein
MAVSNINASLLLFLTFALASVAAAQTSPADSDTSLTLHGVTIYGIVDIGLQYATHGATISDYFSNGGNSLIQKNSYQSVLGGTPSNLSQSRVRRAGRAGQRLPGEELHRSNTRSALQVLIQPAYATKDFFSSEHVRP